MTTSQVQMWHGWATTERVVRGKLDMLDIATEDQLMTLILGVYEAGMAEGFDRAARHVLNMKAELGAA